MRNWTLFILFVSIVLGATNCATVKSDITGLFPGDAEKYFNADNVSVCFVFSHYRQTIGYDAIPKLDSKNRRIRGFDDFFQDALQELSNVGRYSTYTEYASDVNEPERRAWKDSLMRQHDFVLKMKFKREKSFSKYFLGDVFSILSVTLLPVPYRQSYTLDAELFNNRGRLINTYHRKASLTKWVQTMLIFAYPFHPETRKREEIYVEMMHDMFKQIETEKILHK